MPTSLDVSVLPIYRQDGYDQSYLPGLQVVAPPRRAARGRRNDRLIIFFSMTGGSQISPSQHSQILENLTKGYFKTSGTATAAMREVVESLNDYLFKRNRSASGRGRQAVALLTLVVVREERLYMAQCGPVHGLLLTSTGIRHLHDPDTAGRGLGVSQNPAVRFSQAEIAPADLLILTPVIPEGWDETTFHAGFDRNIPALRRRLLADAGSDLTTVLVMVHSGSGQIQLLSSPESINRLDTAPLQQSPVQAAASSRAAPASKRPAPPQAKQQTSIPAPEPVAQSTAPVMSEMPTSQVVSTSPVAAPVDDSAAAQPEAAPKTRKVAPAIFKAGRGASGFFGKLGRGVATFLGRMLPEDAELRLPSSTMAFIAIAVPVVVVTIAALVYLRIGQQAQYDYNIGNVQVIADYALTLTEPSELHEAWSSALVYIDQAEQYRVTDESQALRAQALLILDELDGVTRLDFEPAILGSLGSLVHIQRMLATGSDLYLLDANAGSVLHTTLSGSGQYVLDTDYRCGPGQYGEHIVVKLVDMAALPRPTQFGATIVAIDSNGILLYCSPSESPTASALIPPDNNWGSPRAITVENGNLYVLDPMVNAVWIYFGEDFLFEQPPRFFFAQEVPTIQSSVDIALDGDDLYLLQVDGSMITCTFSAIPEAPTTCQEPAQYSASPSGEAATPLTGNFTFTQIGHTAPPEPSIFLLDAANQTVYHFSLRLNLAAQYRSATSLPTGDIDAFAVSPNRALFIAVGNEIFIAFIR